MQLTILLLAGRWLSPSHRGFLISLLWRCRSAFRPRPALVQRFSDWAGQGPGWAGAPTLLFLAHHRLLDRRGQLRPGTAQGADHIPERTAGLCALPPKLVVLGLIAVQAALLVVVGVAGVRMNRGAFLTSGSPRCGTAARRGRPHHCLDGPGPGRVGVRHLVGKDDAGVGAGHLVQVLLSGGRARARGGAQNIFLLILRPRAGASPLSIITDAGVKPTLLWDHKPSAWLIAMIMLVVLVVVYMLITWWWLIMISPGRSRTW